MGFAYLLYLNDSLASPVLELMRRICQPKSRSLPHITVRYSARKQGKEDLYIYETTVVRSVDLDSAGAFPSSRELHDTDIALRGLPKTVFLGLASAQLESLVYKPKYPDSMFHVTVYDGAPSPFSAELFALLSTYAWNLRIQLPQGTRLTRIGTGVDAAKPVTTAPILSSGATDLWLTLSNGRDALLELSDTQKLRYVDALAALLHDNLAPGDRSDAPVAQPSFKPLTTSEQLPLWGVEEFQPDGAMRLPPQRRWARERAREESLFLTPPELARQMLSEALVGHGPTPVDFGDPALGNGIFFATLKQLVPAQSIRSAIGVELNAARASTVRAKWDDLYVHRGDFVEDRPAAPRSLIVANPPYLRFQKLDRQRAIRWSERLGRALNITIDGRSDLYVYFVLAAHAWMQDGAVACWILPTEFMSSHYGAALREYLTTRVTLLRLHTFDRDDPIFENAKVTSVVVLLRNDLPEPENEVLVSSGGLLSNPSSRKLIGLSTLRRARRWSLTSPTRRSLAQRSRSEHGLVGDLFRTGRGIATGANSWFLLSARAATDLQVPRGWLKPVIPRARRLQGNVIPATDDGRPDVNDFEWLIDIDEDMPTIEATAPRLASYLREVESAVGHRSLLRRRKRFYRQEQIPPPPFFFSYMAPANKIDSRFFWNHSEAVILNNYLGLYPRPSVLQALESGLCSDEELFGILQEVEREDVVDEGRTYSRGLAKVEPSELRAVPLPDSADRLLRWTRQGANG